MQPTKIKSTAVKGTCISETNAGITVLESLIIRSFFFFFFIIHPSSVKKKVKSLSAVSFIAIYVKLIFRREFDSPY